MGFDDSGFSKAGFNDIRINGSLNQVIYGTDLLCFLFKYTDELFTNDFSFLFRFRNAF